MDPSAEGRCASCGFLSRLAGRTDQETGYKGGADAPVYIEVPQDVRENGYFYKVYAAIFGGLVACEPACLLGVASLMEEVEAERDERSENALATLRVLDKPRMCPKWVQYRPGISPKEHLAVILFQEYEKDRRQWAMGMERDRKKLSLSLEDDRQRWETKQELDRRLYEDAQRRHETKLVIMIAIVGAILATVEIGIGVLSSTPDSVAYRWIYGTDQNIDSGD